MMLWHNIDDAKDAIQVASSALRRKYGEKTRHCGGAVIIHRWRDHLQTTSGHKNRNFWTFISLGIVI
ncbi:hypothetical protein Syun_019123 [Stephania yunnanensis]|uniref:Uncharacterized protein n=1 Tax=Stephania yunnanensis TaxID=152371 RepID=A0AAP0ITJ3_9MAGN